MSVTAEPGQPRQDPPNPVTDPRIGAGPRDTVTDARLTALGAEIAGLRDRLDTLNGGHGAQLSASVLTLLCALCALGAAYAVSKRVDRCVGKINGLADELHELARQVNP